MVIDIKIKVGTFGIFSEVQRGVIDEAIHQIYDLGEYAVYCVAVRGFIEELVLFVNITLQKWTSGIVTLSVAL